MPITLKQEDRSSLLSLEGAVDIASAAELKALLIEALGWGKPVHVSISDEGGLNAALNQASLDVTAVQLLWAASREARAAGLELTLDGPVPEPVTAALGSAGFHEFPVAVGNR